MNARCVKNVLPGLAAAELELAKKAGLEEILLSLQPKHPSAEEDVKAPPTEPTDEEIHGIDVLEIEDAVKALWKEGIYAESSMGCTGPVIKTAASRIEKAKAVLKEKGYI
jgi:betaine reductase